MTGHTNRLPAEWEPQAGVLLAWPHAQTDWAQRLAETESAYVALVAAITRFEQAVICVASQAVRERATALLLATSVNLDRCRFVEIEYDDTWLRDSGPISLLHSNGFALADRITVVLRSTARVGGAARRHADWVATEVLATAFEILEESLEGAPDSTIDGQPLWLDLQRVG